MKLIKPVLWTVFGVVIGIAVALTASRLQAQGAGGQRGFSVCTPTPINPDEWMNVQIGGGRNRFILVGPMLCAW